MLNKKIKIYKRTTYWVSIKDACGAVSVNQDGYITDLDTAPYFKWSVKKKMKFTELLKYFTYKKILLSCKEVGVEIDPF